jgi:methylmalonyl-CoA mutase cobalamin-binding subunit
VKRTENVHVPGDVVAVQQLICAAQNQIGDAIGLCAMTGSNESLDA